MFVLKINTNYRAIVFDTIPPVPRDGKFRAEYAWDSSHQGGARADDTTRHVIQWDWIVQDVAVGP